MNVVAIVSTVAAVVGFLFAALSLLVGRAPGWREYRWYALIATTAAVYACCDVVPSTSRDVATVVWASRVSVFMAGVHGFGWIRYIAASARRENTTFESYVAYAGVALGSLSLVPNLVILDRFTVHDVGWLRVSYADASTTTFGMLTYGFAVLSLFVPLAHYTGKWREPPARAHGLALLCLIAAGANDSAVAAGSYRGPYVLDVGFIVVVVAVGTAMGLRFIANARDLEKLSVHLEGEVAERSARLAEVESEVQRNAKLAAIGRLAAGVAHEVNNPAAAILANLQYLRDEAIHGAFPADATVTLDEMVLAVDRIAHIVRQLLDAGRTAGAQERGEPVHVATIVANALSLSRTTRADGVTVRTAVPTELCTHGVASLLEQVLVNLLANAGQALRDAKRLGAIEILAEASSGRVTIRVCDDAGGIPESVRAHLFEPFYTTKKQNEGTGLGLAVSFGLVRSLGGELKVESSTSRGTTMRLDLPLSANGARPRSFNPPKP